MIILMLSSPLGRGNYSVIRRDSPLLLSLLISSIIPLRKEWVLWMSLFNIKCPSLHWRMYIELKWMNRSMMIICVYSCSSIGRSIVSRRELSRLFLCELMHRLSEEERFIADWQTNTESLIWYSMDSVNWFDLQQFHRSINWDWLNWRVMRSMWMKWLPRWK